MALGDPVTTSDLAAGRELAAAGFEQGKRELYDTIRQADADRKRYLDEIHRGAKQQLKGDIAQMIGTAAPYVLPMIGQHLKESATPAAGSTGFPRPATPEEARALPGPSSPFENFSGPPPAPLAPGAASSSLGEALISLGRNLQPIAVQVGGMAGNLAGVPSDIGTAGAGMAEAILARRQFGRQADKYLADLSNPAVRPSQVLSYAP